MSDVAIPDDEFNQLILSNEDLDSLFSDPGQYATAVFDEGTLEKEKLGLVGLPFLITSITYHIPKAAMPRGYVNCDVTIAGPETVANAVKKGWVPNVGTMDDLAYSPGERIKLNDGSTGFRRQVTMILQSQGLIDIGPSDSPSDYDRPWPEWTFFAQSAKYNDPDSKDEKLDVPSFTKDRNGKPIRILARHGLRVSQSPDYPDTNIFYLS